MSFKSFELLPTDENITETIKNDVLHRNECIWSFLLFCNAQEGPCSVAINAKWGDGKTFFVKQSKLLLEALNTSNNMDENKRTTINTAFSRVGGFSQYSRTIIPHLCVYYDAWANDNDVDPILSLVSDIITQTGEDFVTDETPDFLSLGASIIDLITGKNIERILDILQQEYPLSELKKQKNLQQSINEFFESVLYERGERLIIFIDELDRCKPSYAVQLLERVKHYFYNDRVTFVFSVNIDQLQHTIKKNYGNDFDAKRYLDRFFDCRISLPPVDTGSFYTFITKREGFNRYDLICKTVIETYGLSMREIGKFYNSANHGANKITTKKIDFDGFRFATNVFVPIMIALKMINNDLYNEFVEGNNAQPLFDVFCNKDLPFDFFNDLLSNDESFYKNSYNKRVVKLQDKLKEVYTAIFVKKNVANYVSVGYYSFTNNIKPTLENMANMMSKDFTSFA